MGLILDRRFVNLIVRLLVLLLIILLRRHPQYVTGRDAVEGVWRGRQTTIGKLARPRDRGGRQLSFN